MNDDTTRLPSTVPGSQDPATTPNTPTTSTTTPARTHGWHPINVGQFVMGLAFLCMVGGWALVQSGTVAGEDIRWLMPIPWLVAGAAGLVSVAISSARRHGLRR